MATFNQVKRVNNLIVGDQTAKQILLFLAAWSSQCSINEISTFCEIPPKKAIKALNYLIEKGFILRRNGVVRSDTSDPNDDVYQYELFTEVKGN